MTTDRATPAPTPPPPYDDRVERYLDGLMSEQELAGFEAETAGDAAVQGQIAAHRRMVAVLGALAAAPAGNDPLPAPLPMSVRPRMRWLRVATAAAVVALPAAAAIWYFAMQPGTSTARPLTSEQYQQRHRDLMVAEYKSQVASGFKPAEVCNTDEQFVKWTAEKFSHGLKPVHAAPEPVLAGWSHATIFSAYSGLLLASVDGKPVLVVMDTAPPERMVPKDGAAGDLHIFQRRVNDVWMVEVTPLTEARVITRIEAAP
jgi:hypothetical protein